MLRPWLEECSTKHSICNTPAVPGTQLPTRLLDVGFLENGFIRLVESSRFHFTEYIALSHCWGEAQPMTTVKSNLRAHYDKIPFRQLPATFRDAVLLTSALKLRYLWIDSLCIVQDDQDDWETEAGKMAAVYGCSYLTLAVLHSPNNHGGCFSHRYTKQRPSLLDSEWISRVPTESKAIQYRDRDGAVQTTMTRIKPDNAHSLFLGLEHNDTPLGARAWALQERLLAPRTLYFHHEELVWECKAGVNCECQNLQLFGYGLREMFWNEPRTLCPKTDYHWDGAEDRNSAGDAWLRLVTAYSTLKLTKRSDVLPALSGMARHFSPFLVDGGYVAGLWSNDLPRSLMWEKVPQDHCSGPFTFHALPQNDIPSWSWASVVSGAPEEDSQISYQSVLNKGFLKDPSFKIYRLHVQTSPLNPFGSVSGGTIQASRLCITTEFFEVFNWEKTSIALISYNGSVSVFSPDLPLSTPGPYQTLDADSLYCLLIGETGEVMHYFNDVKPGSNGLENPEEAQLALVLKEVTEGGLRKFRRVGYLELRKSKRWFDNAELVTMDIT